RRRTPPSPSRSRRRRPPAPPTDPHGGPPDGPARAGLFRFRDVKKYLITGLLIWIPLVITLWVLKLIVDALDQSLLLLPDWFRTEHWLGVHVPGMGAILTVAIVFLTGVFARNFFGARLVELWHQVLHRIP